MPVKTENAETALHVLSIGLAGFGILTGNVPAAVVGFALECVALIITSARIAEENKSVSQTNAITINPTKTHSNLFPQTKEVNKHETTVIPQLIPAMVVGG